jgi:pilus assembly protein Flp/PilA
MVIQIMIVAEKTAGFAKTRSIRLAEFPDSPCRSLTGRHRLEDYNMSLVIRFLKNESGATAIEYGLIAAGISVAIIAVVQGLGSKLNATFTSVSNALN